MVGAPTGACAALLDRYRTGINGDDRRTIRLIARFTSTAMSRIEPERAWRNWRRAGFRSRSLRGWRFESSRPHCPVITKGHSGQRWRRRRPYRSRRANRARTNR